MQVLTTGEVISKSRNGQLLRWQPECHSEKQRLQVYDMACAACSQRSTFGVSLGEQYICCGNAVGDVYIFAMDSRRAVRILQHSRSRSAICCCVFSADTRYDCVVVDVCV